MDLGPDQHTGDRIYQDYPPVTCPPCSASDRADRKGESEGVGWGRRKGEKERQWERIREIAREGVGRRRKRRVGGRRERGQPPAGLDTSRYIQVSGYMIQCSMINQ